MRWFRNQKLATKMFLAFAVVLALMVGMGCLAVRSMSVVGAGARGIYEGHFGPYQLMAETRQQLMQVREAGLYHMLQQGAAAEEEAEKALKEAQARTLEWLGKLEKSTLDEETNRPGRPSSPA
jgi:hypothetical protein